MFVKRRLWNIHNHSSQVEDDRGTHFGMTLLTTGQEANPLLRCMARNNATSLFMALMGAGLLMALGAGCSDDELLEELDPYQGEWLLPLVHSDVSLEEVSDLDRFSREASVSADDLGLPSGTPVPVPPFVLPLVGPIPVEVASYVHEVQAELASLEFRVVNGLPVALSAGTTFELRNAPDPNDPANLLFSAVMSTDLQPGGTYLTGATGSTISFFDTMYVFLRNVGSPGAPSVDATGASLTIGLTVDLERIALMRIYTNTLWASRDSFEVDLSGELDENTDAATGYLIVHADNGMPLQGSLQFYLYDAAGVRIDSLFDAPFVLDGGQTDAMGRTTAVAATVDSVAVNATRLEHWRDGRSASVVFSVNTNGYPGPYVSADSAAALRLQVVGDMRLNISYSSL
jgi:hypothetical protein